MSKNANAGELRTTVRFMRIERTTNDNGIPVETEINIFGDDKSVMCKWSNVHGTEVFDSMQLQLRDPATITTRYSPLLDDVTLIIYREADTRPYEVISIDNVEQRNVWLEIKAQRMEAAR
jgi:head-tail adaptor